MIKHFFVLAALLLADPRPVHAGSSCGGGGGDGGSSSGGSGGSSSGGSSSGGGSSSSDYSSSSSDSATYTQSTGCIDDTDVHGFRRCTKFGAWATNMRIPKLFVEVGSAVRQFDSGLATQSGAIAHGAESFSYRVVMPTSEPARDVAMVSTLRLGFGVPRGFYSGLEFELGGLVAPASASAEMTTTGTFGSPEVRQSGGLVLGFTGIGGYRASGQRGSIAIEGAGGVRSVRYHFDSYYHNCESTTTIAATRGVVEARARGELWLSPWITAGATLGANVLDRQDWMAGVFVGFHSRAFAGTR
jgi:hypothetical protein